MYSKKAIAKSTLAAMIIILFSFVAIAMIMSDVSTDASEEGEILKCRLSVMQRAVAKMPFTGHSLGGLQCKTIRKNVGEENNEKEAVMREIADYSVGCWNMFGEGMLRSLRDSDDESLFQGVLTDMNLFGLANEESFCFVCYEVLVRDIEEEQTISYTDFLSFYNFEVYKAEPKPCREDDEECIARRDDPGLSLCIRNGGECLSSCSGDLVVAPSHEKWLCADDDETCCLEKSEVYTYLDYLKYNSGMDGRLLIDEDLEIESGETYGIVYIEPVNKDIPSYVGIGDWDMIDESECVRK